MSVDIELSEMLQIVTLAALLTGLAFGYLEVRGARRDRDEKGALNVLSVAVRPDHIAACFAILDLPENAPHETIVASPELRGFANTLMVLYEYLGNLVYQRMVPLDMLDLLVGGIIRATWKRLNVYIEQERVERGLPNIAEWFQWLAEHLEESGRPDKAVGTHVAYRDWEP
jgi:hypothetical protein